MLPNTSDPAVCVNLIPAQIDRFFGTKGCVVKPGARHSLYASDGEQPECMLQIDGPGGTSRILKPGACRVAWS
jgi:hypothetical protein